MRNVLRPILAEAAYSFVRASGVSFACATGSCTVKGPSVAGFGNASRTEAVELELAPPAAASATSATTLRASAFRIA